MPDISRRTLVEGIVALAVFQASGCGGERGAPPADTGETMSEDAAVGAGRIERLDVKASAWKPLLSPDAYAVLFEESTERPYSSPLAAEKRPGIYVCAACFLPLFDAAAKYESGTGWPSFFRVLEGHVETKRDFKLLLPRTEYHCVRCGGHQGHLFRDGPKPTYLRYCNNGLALRFVAEGEPLPELRTPA